MDPSAPVTRATSRAAQHWTLLTALFAVASFLEIVLFTHLFAFTPLFLQSIGFNEEGVKLWTGILASVGVAVGLWFVPFWGVLADRYGRKLLILRSFAIEAGATFLMALSSNVWLFLFGRMIIGLSLGNTGLMFATLADEAPPERVGLAISLVTGVQPLGGVIGSVAGGFLVSRFGLHWVFAIDASITALVTLVIAWVYQEEFTPGSEHPLTRMLSEALRSVIHTPVALTMFSFSFIATFGYFFSYTFVSNRIVQIATGSDIGTTIGYVYGTAGIAALISAPLWGAAADRWGHRRLLPIVTLLTALFYLPLYFAADVTQFALRLFLLFAVTGSINSLSFAVIGLETPPEKRNAVMSMIFMPLNAAILIAPVLAGIVTREIRDVFLYSAVIVFMSFLVLVFANRSQMRTPGTV